MDETSALFDHSLELLAVLSRPDPGWLRTNPAFGVRFGWQQDDLRGEPVQRLVHSDDHRALEELAGRLDQEEGPFSIDLHVMKIGGGYEATRWRLVPTSDQRLLCIGRPKGGGGDERLESRFRMLANDIEHRLRNNLAVIRSIIRRTAVTATDDQAIAHLQGRIDAYARVQSKLRFAGAADQDIDLAALIQDELLAQTISEGPTLAIDGPDVALSQRAAETIALAVHELATNAIKFGAFSVRGGRVEISWRIRASDDGPRLWFIWSESGVPLDERPSRHDGFGMETLLRSLPYDLLAETDVDFRQDGVRFTLSAPLAALAQGAA